MKEIPLSNSAKKALVSQSDFGLVSRYKWHLRRGSHGDEYAATTVRGHHLMMHHMVGGFRRQDHRDGNSLNNQRRNLRPCTHVQNMRNQKRHRDGSSRFKGVSWCKARGSWAAQIKHDNKAIFIGRFKSERDAAKAYNAAAKKYFGRFARLNYL